MPLKVLAWCRGLTDLTTQSVLSARIWAILRRLLGIYTISSPLARWAMCFALAAAGCAHLPKGRYAIDDVEIEGQSGLSSSDIEDKIATAASPHFLGLPRGWSSTTSCSIVMSWSAILRGWNGSTARTATTKRTRAPVASRRPATGTCKVTIVVEEGPVVLVGDVKLEGILSLSIDDSAAALKAIRRKKLREKQPFDEDNYDRAREGVVKALADRGYAFAQVKGSVEIDLAKHLAHVTFTVTAGQKATIGAVSIERTRRHPRGAGAPSDRIWLRARSTPRRSWNPRGKRCSRSSFSAMPK